MRKNCFKINSENFLANSNNNIIVTYKFGDTEKNSYKWVYSLHCTSVSETAYITRKKQFRLVVYLTVFVVESEVHW
jgi:hypothetical protein